MYVCSAVTLPNLHLLEFPAVAALQLRRKSEVEIWLLKTEMRKHEKELVVKIRNLQEQKLIGYSIFIWIHVILNGSNGCLQI